MEVAQHNSDQAGSRVCLEEKSAQLNHGYVHTLPLLLLPLLLFCRRRRRRRCLGAGATHITAKIFTLSSRGGIPGLQRLVTARFTPVTFRRCSDL